MTRLLAIVGALTLAALLVLLYACGDRLQNGPPRTNVVYRDAPPPPPPARVPQPSEMIVYLDGETELIGCPEGIRVPVEWMPPTFERQVAPYRVAGPDSVARPSLALADVAAHFRLIALCGDRPCLTLTRRRLTLDAAHLETGRVTRYRYDLPRRRSDRLAAGLGVGVAPGVLVGGFKLDLDLELWRLNLRGSGVAGLAFGDPLAPPVAALGLAGLTYDW